MGYGSLIQCQDMLGLIRNSLLCLITLSRQVHSSIKSFITTYYGWKFSRAGTEWYTDLDHRRASLWYAMKMALVDRAYAYRLCAFGRPLQAS
jgi:hypothetical protein